MRGLFLILLFVAFETHAELQWEQKANFRGIGRHRATAFAIKDKGYICLGHINSVVNIPMADIWEYDPATDTWSQKADYPTGGNYGAAAFVVGSKAYVGNGVYSSNGEFFEFDPAKNTWTQIANCPLATSEETGFGIGDKGYFVGDGELHEYNPQTNSWTQKASPPSSWGIWTSSFVAGGKGYYFSDGNLYEYKQSENKWITRAPNPGIATAGAAAFSINGKGYIVAGYGDWLSDIVNETWEFNPGDNTWTQLEDFPGTNRRFTVGFNIGNFGYVGTGTNGVNFNDFYQLGDTKDFYSNVDELNKIDIKVYPNPTSDFITVEMPSSITNTTFKLLNIDGKMVLNENTKSTNTIQVSQLPKGVYVYQILDNTKELKTGKLQIQ